MDGWMGTKQLANCRDYYFEKSMKVVFYIQGAWHFPKMVPTMFHSPAFLITCMTYHSPSIRHPLSSTGDSRGSSVNRNVCVINGHGYVPFVVITVLSSFTTYIVSPGLQSELHDGYHKWSTNCLSFLNT